ncbi:MAG: PQQ-binding-like beta-propeller repeat protein [Alphaproteobacteria bacterium]|nr:PQQ-binding-like beta-propeller repeat protein [Alphaproteobacteria bacterium]MCW5739103.1 PQQ-binding-like beta-propeller repeat protein [Alphaproteobacteria bacterium]
MRQLLALCALLPALSACDTISDVFAKSKPPLPGDRVSVLQGDDEVKVDAAGDITLPRPAVNDSWPQSGGFANFAMHHLEIGDAPQVAWSVDVGAGSGSDRHLLTPPVVANGRVFVKDAQATVSAYDAATGKQLWRVTLKSTGGRDDDEFGGGLAFYGNRLFVTTGFAEVISLNPEDGAEIWRRAVSAPVRGAPTVFADRVFAISVDNKLHALAAIDGAELWEFAGLQENAGFLSGPSPSASQDYVIAPFSSGELVALRLDSGRQLWNESLIAQRRGGAQSLAALSDIRGRPVIDRGRVLAIGSAGQVGAFELHSGARIWDKPIAGSGTPWVAGRYVFVISGNNEIVCLDREDGRVRWVTPLTLYSDAKRRQTAIWVGPVLAGDRLLIGGGTGDLLAISPYDGQPIGKVSVGSPVLLAPVIADRTIYVLTDSGRLIALR